MNVFGLAGWSGSGKTTLMVKLLPELTARGLVVSTIKHAHHHFDIDKPGKDSHRHREAGATEVLISSKARWALMHENRDEEEASLEELLTHMTPVDLIMVEGFKRDPLVEKILVHRLDTHKGLPRDPIPNVVAVASDDPALDCDLPLLDLNDVAAIADYIIDRLGLSPAVPLAQEQS